MPDLELLIPARSCRLGTPQLQLGLLGARLRHDRHPMLSSLVLVVDEYIVGHICMECRYSTGVQHCHSGCSPLQLNDSEVSSRKICKREQKVETEELMVR